MIRVERHERAAGEDAARELIGALDERPGAWLGCDVSLEGLYRRHSVGCVDPALSFYLDGPALRVLSLNDTGCALLEALRPMAGFAAVPGGLQTRFARCAGSPHPALRLLRQFLALFGPAHAELGLYGAWSFDYYRLADGGGLPDDGRRRFVLHFPERVLVHAEHEARWIEFRFPDLPQPGRQAAPPVLEPVQPQAREDELPRGGHARRVAQGVELLRSGKLVSIVLSQTFRRPLRARASAAFEALRARNPYPAMFFLNLGGGEKVFGASPDLQVRAEGEWVESAPVCGTVRRGADALEDVAQALALLGSDKEAAALSGCADSDCNDKAQVCVPGSVELLSHRRIHHFSTIVHTIAHTRGRRRPGVDGLDVLLAHAAPATVAGVPKREALAAIERIESSWRGWYGGAAARIGSDGSAEVYTILRAARIAGDVAEVRTGGNLLVDSDPAAEEEESRLKAQTLFRVLEGESPAGLRAAPAIAAGQRARLVDLGDPYRALLVDALARGGIGLSEDAPAAIVTADVAAEPAAEAMRAAPTRRALLIGSAGIALLAGEGARTEVLALPRFARTAQARVDVQGPLAGLGAARLGVYAARTVREAGLPRGWRCAAAEADGTVLAAVHEASRRCVLLFRPDSILSRGGSAGERSIRAALEWITA